MSDFPGLQVSPSGAHGGEGGAIFGSGKLVLYESTISRNKGGNGSSGGYGSYNLNIAEPVLSDGENTSLQPHFIYWQTDGGPGAPGGTGGICCQGSLSMTLCTVSGNVGGAGGAGGGSSGGFPGSLGPDGGRGGSGGPGGVFCSSSNALTLIACTLADNSGGAGGAGGGGEGDAYTTGRGAGGVGGVGGILETNDAAAASFINTIVARNCPGKGGATGPYVSSLPTNGVADVRGAFNSLGHNLIGQANGSSGFTNGVNGDLAGSTNAPLDPVLGPLGDNGGPTFTMALLHGSPALDAGYDALLQPPYNMKTDQRGFARKSGQHVDIGAFEYQYGNATASMPQPIVSGTMLGNGNAQANATSAVVESGTSAGFQLRFSNSTPGATFTVLATSDLSVPVEQWSVVGQAVQVGAGLFQFTDVAATNVVSRFYRVSAP